MIDTIGGVLLQAEADIDALLASGQYPPGTPARAAIEAAISAMHAAQHACDDPQAPTADTSVEMPPSLSGALAGELFGATVSSYSPIFRIRDWLRKHGLDLPPDALKLATAAILDKPQATETDVLQFWQGLGIDPPAADDTEAVGFFMAHFAIAATDSRERTIQQRRQEAEADRKHRAEVKAKHRRPATS
jgi:hypothetical protein